MDRPKMLSQNHGKGGGVPAMQILADSQAVQEWEELW